MLDLLTDQKVLIAAAVGAVGFLAYRQFSTADPTTTPSAAKRKAAEGSGNEVQVLESLKELPRGSMKEVPVDERNKVLVVHASDGNVYATSSKCTHYGAPLAKGVLCGTRVTCPWHAACFNVASGDIEDAPALDGIHTFPTRVGRDGAVYAELPDPFPASHKRGLVRKRPIARSQEQHVVVVGGGPAGLVAMQTLRERGFTGRVTMISNESALPYDRIKLSKVLTVEVPDMLLRGEAFYADNEIQTMLGDAVAAVDPAAHSVQLESGATVSYDKLILATGGNPRQILVDGSDLANIFTLRFPGDSAGIVNACDGASRVVVVGSSFIGMEAAAYLRQTKQIENVIVVGMETVPFERVLGPELGRLMQDLHESKGIAFRMQRTVKTFLGKGGQVTGVILDNGEELPADCVVIGAGIIPATGFLQSSGIKTERDGSIMVDDSLRVAGVDDIYAIGDIARFPYWKNGGATIRVEHWDVAQQHGRVAACHIAGVDGDKYRSIPFFWTQQLGANIRYAGNAMKWDKLVLHGSTQLAKKISPIQGFYLHDGKVIAVVTINKDPVAAAAFELLRVDKMPSADEVIAKSGDIDLVALLKGE